MATQGIGVYVHDSFSLVKINLYSFIFIKNTLLLSGYGFSLSVQSLNTKITNPKLRLKTRIRKYSRSPVMYNKCYTTIPRRGWSGVVMVLGKLPVPGRPTNLDHSRTRACCAYSRCRWGLFGHFFPRLSFLSSLSLSLGDGPI